MTHINKREYTALKTATLNDGHMFIQTPNWWSAPVSIDGPWPTSTIRSLVKRGLMEGLRHKPHA